MPERNRLSRIRGEGIRGRAPFQRAIEADFHVGGWGDLSLVQRYSHLSPDHCKEALKRIAGEYHVRIHNSPISGEVVHLADRAVSM